MAHDPQKALRAGLGANHGQNLYRKLLRSLSAGPRLQLTLRFSRRILSNLIQLCLRDGCGRPAVLGIVEEALQGFEHDRRIDGGRAASFADRSALIKATAGTAAAGDAVASQNLTHARMN